MVGVRIVLVAAVALACAPDAAAGVRSAFVPGLNSQGTLRIESDAAADSIVVGSFTDSGSTSCH